MVECGEIKSLASMGIVFAVSPRAAVAVVLVAGIWAPIVVASALVVSGLVPLVGATSFAVGAIIAMVLVALVASWIISHGVVYN